MWLPAAHAQLQSQLGAPSSPQFPPSSPQFPPSVVLVSAEQLHRSVSTRLVELVIQFPPVSNIPAATRGSNSLVSGLDAVFPATAPESFDSQRKQNPRRKKEVKNPAAGVCSSADGFATTF
ncbi:hypothetical protein EYF80_038342 [Liparis tanakae]|uniref:Uncharacterized protein n=1 Tax=Liparis tanakae TaxID=230148 RepID=A0A4Z2GDT5_9TELE|nr:hypothetical protein EYF80_038342 [Liparis tanakae]